MDFQEPMTQQHTMEFAPDTLVVTDLGPGSTGAIGMGEVPAGLREEMVRDVAAPEYVRQASPEVRCMDGRRPEGGIDAPEGSEPMQMPGGEPEAHVVLSMMQGAAKPKSELVKEGTEQTVRRGRTPVVHERCGANGKDRDALRMVAKEIDVIAPTAWTLGEAIGLDHYITTEDMLGLAVTGGEAAEDDALWDVTDEESLDIAESAGAKREKLHGDHNEKVARVDVSEYTFDGAAFIEDHPAEDDGENYQAFSVTLGAYAKQVFEDAAKEGRNPREAAMAVMSSILFTVGISKVLTAPKTEDRPNDALPIVVVGKA